LKSSQVNRLERLYRRRVSPGEVVSLELGRELAEISLEIRRQIGILVSRIGEVAYVIVGDERGLLIPTLEDYPLGRRLLRGVSIVAQHLGSWR
jgi:GTP-binding protein HflX